MKKNTKKGFTLVELLVVIAILAILASVAVVGYTAFIDKANKAKVDAEVKDINLALTSALIDPSVKAIKLADDIYVIKNDAGNIVSATCPSSITAEDISEQLEDFDFEISGNDIVHSNAYTDADAIYDGIACPDSHAANSTCGICGKVTPPADESGT